MLCDCLLKQKEESKTSSTAASRGFLGSPNAFVRRTDGLVVLELVGGHQISGPGPPTDVGAVPIAVVDAERGPYHDVSLRNSWTTSLSPVVNSSSG